MDQFTCPKIGPDKYIGCIIKYRQMQKVKYTVCPIWKSLTLFYNYGEANYILALSKAVFSMILAYILIFENFFGFRDR